MTVLAPNHFFLMHHLDKTSIDLLSSQQVITGVMDVVKELLENSLDSGAKTIKILLEDIGLKRIKVSDDGSGITREGRDEVCLAHTTSKIANLSDLNNDLSTFGFRGEALHSLCCLADVSITTRCRDEDSAVIMSFNRDGTIKTQNNATAPYGTTVIVENLMASLPVRIRDERAKFNPETLRLLLQKYFLASPSVRFVFECSPHLSITRPPLTNLSQAASLEFGAQVFAALRERNVESFVGDIRAKLHALLPSTTADWKAASTSRNQISQTLIVNGRPVKNANIQKAVNEYYWSIFGSLPKRYPRFVICIDFFREQSICSALTDVNRDAGKIAIAFSDENSVLKLVERALSTENNKQKLAAIAEYPSTEVNIVEEEFTSFAPFGTYKWKEAGKMDEYSLFGVAGKEDVHLIAVRVQGLFEQCGVASSEVSRIAECELIPMYWDKILELHEQSPRLVHIARLQ